MREVSNLKNGHAARAAALLVPTGFVILALSGVAAKPAMGLKHARDSRELARQRAERCELERERFAEFEAARGFERLSEAVARIDGLVPQRISELDAHSAVRVVAEAHGLALESVSVGELVDPGLPRADDMVAMQRIQVSGVGELTDAVATVATLRELGFPVAVLECTFTRVREPSTSFSMYVTLGLFQSVPLPDESEEQPSQEGAS